MKTINYLEFCNTIDQCVAFLESIGCNWDYEKETELEKSWKYQYKDTLVIYDPMDLLSIDK